LKLKVELEYYAEHITRPRGWIGAWLLGVLARESPHATRTTTNVTSSFGGSSPRHRFAAAAIDAMTPCAVGAAAAAANASSAAG